MIRMTLRLRLTLLYSGLFALAGALLLTLTYLLARWRLVGEQQVPVKAELPEAGLPGDVVTEIRADVLETVLWQSALAFLIMVVLVLALGWFTAGRALRPVRQISALAKRLSHDRLDARISLRTSDDELKDLADSFDHMLDRLQRAFEAQRLFVANASHELRTPLTLIRTSVDVLAAKPAPTPADYQAGLRRIAAASERSEKLIAGLLSLARTQSTPVHTGEVDLAALAREALDGAGVSVRLECGPAGAPVRGDSVLLTLLVRNLVDNAVRHNRADGWIQASLGRDGDHITLEIENSGPVVPSGELVTLREPFSRGSNSRAAGPAGHGLGLAIVDAVVAAHDGSWNLCPGRDGGLRVRVNLPAIGTR